MKNKMVWSFVGVLISILLSHNVMAGFYVEGPVDYKGPMVTKSHTSARSIAKTTKKRTLVKQPSANNNGLAFGVKTYTIHDGSLKRNIERIVRLAKWGKVVWTLPYDYRWVGKSEITGDSTQDVLQKLLAGYPLQAVFYEQNHIVQIKPRPSIAYRAPTQLTHANASVHNPDQFIDDGEDTVDSQIS